MTPRWIALAIGLVMLGIVGIFLWAVIRPPAPPSESAPGAAVSGEKRSAGRASAWTLAAEAVPRSDRTVALTVSAKDLEGRPIAPGASPSAVLRMLDMGMEPEPVALVQDGPGFWRGSARLAMAGRWSLQVQLNGETLNVPFESR